MYIWLKEVDYYFDDELLMIYCSKYFYSCHFSDVKFRIAFLYSSFGNFPLRPIEISILSTHCSIAGQAEKSKILLLLMNWRNMLLHLLLLSATVYTFTTFQWLFSFMNWCNIFSIIGWVCSAWGSSWNC